MRGNTNIETTKVGASLVARSWNARDLDLLITESADEDILDRLRDIGVKVQTVG